MLALKTGVGVVLAATSDAVVGATATIVVGFLAAASALGVAWIQTRNNRERDMAAREMLGLAKQLSEIEHERAQDLADELTRLRNEEEDGQHG